MAALTIALLGHEVVLPLFVLNNIVIPEVHTRRREQRGVPVRIGFRSRLPFHGAVFATVSAVIVYKVVVYANAPIPAAAGFDQSIPQYAAQLVTEAVLTDLGTHGIGLPTRPGGAPRRPAWPGSWWRWPWASPCTSNSTGSHVVIPFGGLRRRGPGWRVSVGIRSVTRCSRRRAGSSSPERGWRTGSRRRDVGRRLDLRGLGRLGVDAATLASCAGPCSPRVRGGTLLGRRGRVQRPQHLLADSARSQQRMLTEVKASLLEVPSGSTVLLAGICPYAGPAPVFESPFDFAGALQIRHGDPSIRADIVTERLAVEPRAITTTIYGVGFRYLFGRDLLLHDASRGRTVALPDAVTARRELRAIEQPPCAEGKPGKGSALLPFDRVLIVLEDTRFRPWRRL